MTSTRTTMQTPAPPVFAPLRRALRSTKAEYRNSFGTQVCSYPFALSFGDCFFWRILNEVENIWKSSIQPQIVELLKDRRSELRPSTTPSTAQEPHFALKCYMIGPNTGHAHPHVLIICRERFFGDKVRRIVLGHGLLSRVGWGKAIFAFQAEIEQPAGASPSNENLTVLNQEEHIVYSINKQLPQNLCGTGIEIRIGTPPWRTATIGGMIEIDEKFYGLTIAHVFQANPIEPSQFSPEASPFDESDLDLYEDNILDGSIPIYDEEQRKKEIIRDISMVWISQDLSVMRKEFLQLIYFLRRTSTLE